MFIKIQKLIDSEKLSSKTYVLFEEKTIDKERTNYSYEEIKNIWRKSKHSIAHIVINNENTLLYYTLLKANNIYLKNSGQLDAIFIIIN